MFTKYRKLSKKSAAAILIAVGAILAALVMIRTLPGSGFGLTEVINVSDAEGRIKYLSRLGWDIDAQSERVTEIVLPKEFGESLMLYNDMQRLQGFDLWEYRGMDCTQYEYIVTNYSGCEDTVYVTLFVRRGRVIAGDIHSAKLDGFMHGIR